MAGNGKSARLGNLRKIEGHPGFYTIIEVSHNPRKEKALLAKIARDAKKLRENTYLARFLTRATTHP